jgi:hypothetical protein
MSGASSTVRGNLVLKAKEFKADTVVGEVVSGPAAGTEIEVKYSGTLGQKDYTKKRGKSEVNIENGGTLRIEGVSEGKEGVYDSRWMITFNGSPKVGQHNVIPDAVCNYVDNGRRDNEDRPKLKVNQLIMDAEKHVTSVEGLQSAIEAGFAAEGAVTLFGQDDEGNVIQAPFFRSGSMVDGNWVANDAAERAAETIESFGDGIAQVEAVLKKGGFSVVPTRGYSVGPTTAENIERLIEEASEKGVRARISTIDPQNWVCPTIGMRLQRALSLTGDAALPADTGAKLAEAFKSYGDKAEAATFESKGWRGLSDDTLTKFFASVGVTLRQHPSTGWSTQTLLEDRMDGMDRGFAVKGFQQMPTAPYPAVEACADARNAYYTEMTEACEAAVAGLRVEAGAGKKVDEKSAAEAPKDELPADEGDALDDLLGDVSDDMQLDG